MVLAYGGSNPPIPAISVMNHILLGSKSISRQTLLKESKINYKIIEQNFDESLCDWGLPLQKLVESLAQHKMDHSILPDAKKDDEVCLVLTADTLGLNSKGEIQGKPASKEDAIQKIKSYRNGATTGTAFCLEQKVFKSGNWLTQKHIVQYAQAEYIFDVPDHLINWYLENGFQNQDYLDVSGAVQIEGLGFQFLKVMNGSYTSVLGLPLYELRKALEDIGFGY